MAKIIGKELLCRVDLKYFKAIQGIGNKTLFDRFLSLDNIVKNNIDPLYQGFLAYPVKEGGFITFHGKTYSETPHILSELQGEEREKYETIKSETVSHFEQKTALLKTSGKAEDAEFLAGAVKFIDDRFVYCYDDLVVLGVWGMQLRDNIREDISVIRKDLRLKKKKEIDDKKEDIVVDPDSPIVPYHISFHAGENGVIYGDTYIKKEPNSFLTDEEIPHIEPYEGYVFDGWDENPSGYEITGDKKFVAQYRPIEAIPPPTPDKLPWHTRFWNWLGTLFTGKGCLKWLLWLLLILLLLWLLSWLFRGCDGGFGDGFDRGGGAVGDNDSTWIVDDPNVGSDGGIYDPYNPYQPKPTPPKYDAVLPPQEGVLPPISKNPDIIPGNPTIIGNRLNILMENEDKSIMDLAVDFKEKYPDDNYQVVYYDDVVKRMQIEIPREERVRLKAEIPQVFAPEYELFVFDEALFEGTQVSHDLTLSDPDKSWHLKAINATQAWDITKGSEEVTVAIVDNGFDLKHVALEDKVVGAYNVWTRSAQVFPQEVDHGTHVAGIALAIAGNNRGISGVAPGCKFMPVQVADENGLMTTTSVLDGILYSLYQGADVINVSLGGQFTGISQYPEQEQQRLINDHFKEEERLWLHIMRIAANHNATLVVAAGNDNVLAGIDALQRPELFITVSAVDKNLQNPTKAPFSNYGTYSTISAPGVGIYGPVGRDEYTSMDGTSMAAPIVAGAVALMKSINDAITTKQIICILQSTGLQTQGDIGKLIQLDKALQLVKSGEGADCTPVPSSGDVQILLSWDNYNDLDLICTDPDGESIFFRNRRVPSGGQLEIDMNVEYPDSKTPLENIFWEPGNAPSGTYNVYLLYYKQHESRIGETPYQIQVKYSGKTEDYNGTLKKEGDVIHVCSFSLGAENLSSQSSVTSPVSNRQSELEQERNHLQRELDRVNNELRRITNGV